MGNEYLEGLCRKVMAEETEPGAFLMALGIKTVPDGFNARGTTVRLRIDFIDATMAPLSGDPTDPTWSWGLQAFKSRDQSIHCSGISPIRLRDFRILPNHCMGKSKGPHDAYRDILQAFAFSIGDYLLRYMKVSDYMLEAPAEMKIGGSEVDPGTNVKSMLECKPPKGSWCCIHSDCIHGEQE